MATRQRITSPKKAISVQEQKKKKQANRYRDYKNPDITIDICRIAFMIKQEERDNSKATLDFYKRCFKKFNTYLEEHGDSMKNMPVECLSSDAEVMAFKLALKAQGLGQQTINSYLRGFRAFGNYCLEEGYIDNFECSIKEVDPPVKQVYTDKELELLMKKPEIDDFAAFRTYCMISLILNTGARANTLLNIKICDLDLDEGYIAFNTTKTHKVVRLGLDKKTKRDLTEWVNYWRYDKDAEENDYLFCNEYGEQLSRSALSKSFRIYNRSRGVEKTSIHLLRHTFAKKWITSGGDIITLAKVLTHSELDMVKRYANLYGEDVKEEIQVHSAIAQMKTKSGKTLKNRKKLSDD